LTAAATRERLLSLTDSFAGARIAVAGDYVLDRFLYGYPKRVSREAPVLILRFWKQEDLPGGAGNTAANVRSLGGEPLPVGAVGPDAEGRALREALERLGISTEGLVETPEYITPTKTRILGGAAHSIKQQIVRYDREEPLPSDASLVSALEARLDRTARRAAGAILSDYGYGAISAAAIPRLRAALPDGAPILVDSRHALASYVGADALTPNEEELEEVSGLAIEESEETLDLAARDLARRTGSRAVLVTRGSRGMALYETQRDPVRIPVHGTDQVADVTGAGDTVLAAFSLALASGASPLEAALLANFAGGVVVMKMGTATVTADELRRAIAADRAILPTGP